MRYGKSIDLLHLAFEMQGAAEGISLRDIEEHYSVSRRTAERMRDAVMAVFPQAEEYSLGDGLKRWRIRSNKSISQLPVSAEELVAIQSAAKMLRQDSRLEQARLLDGVEKKLRSLLRPDTLTNIGLHCEALTRQVECFATDRFFSTARGTGGQGARTGRRNRPRSFFYNIG